MLKKFDFFPYFAAAVIGLTLGLAACAVNSAGNETIAGINTGIPATDVAIVQADVQTAVNALPSLCTEFANATAMTNAELALLAQVTKLPAQTVANISNASVKGNLICSGTVAIVATGSQAPAGTPPTATP